MKDTQLIQVETIKPLELFTPQGADSILKEIANKTKDFKADISTKKGRDEIKSLAHKITRSKTALDDLGKELVSEWKNKSKQVDNERKKIRDGLDSLKENIRKPLTDFENEEKLRISERESRIKEMKQLADGVISFSSKMIEEIITKLNDLIKYDWHEFKIKADETYNAQLSYWNQELEKVKKSEKEKAELEELKKAKAEQEQKAREEQIKKEAAETAKHEAEQQLLKKQEEESKAEEARIEAENKRIADKNHRSKINYQILLALAPYIGDDEEAETKAKAIIISITKGMIPNLSINY